MTGRRHLTRFRTAARRDLGKIPQPDAIRILRRLAELQQALDAGDTNAFDIKALQGHQAHWRLRIGDYRAVYTLEEGPDGALVVTVWVVAVGHRREVYRTV
ncbi:type II toxin-antitoxin system RelE/ParE family toxin [Streptomyces avidinii]|uniref:type II toxin-antitoxin system RelE family toxin n=1 Tax=Streptomyces avidinii TaxID=1895 RepID=UPI0038704C5B|nr:type II toxin-antitoxin system RelE/ParE family toxin [Streptomyces avidinii]